MAKEGTNRRIVEVPITGLRKCRHCNFAASTKPELLKAKKLNSAMKARLGEDWWQDSCCFACADASSSSHVPSHGRLCERLCHKCGCASVKETGCDCEPIAWKRRKWVRVPDKDWRPDHDKDWLSDKDLLSDVALAKERYGRNMLTKRTLNFAFSGLLSEGVQKKLVGGLLQGYPPLRTVLVCEF